MADDADMANDEGLFSLSVALAGRVQYRGESAHFCIDCDERIPEARRANLPGVQTCVSCQAERERDARRHHAA